MSHETSDDQDGINLSPSKGLVEVKDIKRPIVTIRLNLTHSFFVKILANTKWPFYSYGFVMFTGLDKVRF